MRIRTADRTVGPPSDICLSQHARVCAESCRAAQLETLAWDGLFISAQGKDGSMRGSEKLVGVANFWG